MVITIPDVMRILRLHFDFNDFNFMYIYGFDRSEASTATEL